MRHSKWSVAGKFILILLVISAGFTLLFLLLNFILPVQIFEPLISERYLSYLEKHKVVIFSILLSILLLFSSMVIILIWRISMRQTQKKIAVILNSIDEVFQKSDELIQMPKEFRDTENKLNAIKYESIKSEQLAKEAEQRKNDLVVYLAHDLKTPLTSVIGYLTLLHDEREISKELREKYLEISLKKACRLEELINEFFDITRFNLQNISLDKTNIDLSMMLLQLSEEFYPTLSAKQLNCQLNFDESITLYADADKIARAFDNLLRNACAYSTPNSTIQISAYLHQNNVIITFENQGKRIPEERLHTIFEKFFRLDSARSSQTGGAGLGLAITKEIIELHHGSISASSDDHSTRFTIVLPLES